MSNYTGMRDVPGLVADCQPFKSGNGTMSGTGRPLQGIGKLPHWAMTMLVRADYVVRSYQTPILWHAEGRWWYPDVNYSMTTSRHQAAACQHVDPIVLALDDEPVSI